MRYLVCCITRSKFDSVYWFSLLLLTTVSIFAQGTGRQLSNTVVAVSSPSQQIVSLNTLADLGKIPYHLMLEFQVYTLDGKPSEQGTIEQWWSEKDGAYLSITAPSLGTVHAIRFDLLPTDNARRTLQLASMLLATVTRPVSSTNQAYDKTEVEGTIIGGVNLHCFRSDLRKGTGATRESFCIDSTQLIRVISDSNFTTIRNRSGVFHGTKICFEGQISSNNKVAISGHVTTLQGFDPAIGTVKLESYPKLAIPTQAPGTAAEEKVSWNVLAAEKLSGKQPEYPYAARVNRISGTVVLAAQISESGTIAILFPIASPDSLLTQAAIDAVKTWTYRPCMLNGKPVALHTTITINFNMNRS